ncbi:hypothetical protein DMA12_34290 [Amycolatopsis balhimycina DSM 5908]|uniref:ATPase AAA-type core domain-containing protein n=1 Tax=Amycolatopsis balhimycina DSM 5908 TaxID=1081091 RepID=A0A428W502_AMYBA|nr:AAA family ATPase [Amycolatopsis balhimycina]RSM38150.1 hypothetical protein DMA12_34290 [Amycolatopsis balhimycina DSM 5908]
MNRADLRSTHDDQLDQSICGFDDVEILKDLRLRNFRAFQDFRLTFGSGAYLIGPNNAGKSTILTALRVADVLIRLARRRKPDDARVDGDRKYPIWPIPLTEFPALRESVRYEFRGHEARLELTWKSGARLVAVWPKEDDETSEPFFYLERKPGLPVRDVKQAREAFPELGVIPILNPIDHTESQLQDGYVERNISGRLSSRHFRNQLRLLNKSNKLDSFLEFAEPWIDGIQFTNFGQHLGSGSEGVVLDVYHTEPGSRAEKELVWAGDGIQVWLQLLYHIYRVRDFDTIILDEPEVYLHPDLQRRLVHLLEATGRQIIVATHSSEIAAEAEPRLVTLVEKGRKNARRARDEATLEQLSSTLGTAFNLRLARALRSRVVLFVEGQDMAVIRRFSKTLRLANIELEKGITVIKLEGFSRFNHVAPFTWLRDELLPEAIKVHILPDRDYRSNAAISGIEQDFDEAGISAHIWRRKELESYLLTPSVIARLSGLTEAEATEALSNATLAMENDVFSRLLGDRIQEEKSGSRHAVDVTAKFKTEFDEEWTDLTFRLYHCPAKQVIARLNDWLQTQGKKSVSSRSLASAHRVGEIAPEMADALRQINAAVTNLQIL